MDAVSLQELHELATRYGDPAHVDTIDNADGALLRAPSASCSLVPASLLIRPACHCLWPMIRIFIAPHTAFTSFALQSRQSEHLHQVASCGCAAASAAWVSHV